MQIMHEIVGFDEANLQLQVRYYTNEVPDGFTFSIDLEPDEEGNLPSNSDIDGLIDLYAPKAHFERLERIKRVSKKDLSLLKGRVTTRPLPQPKPFIDESVLVLKA